MLVCAPTDSDPRPAPAAPCACQSPAFARLNGLMTAKLGRRALLAGGAGLAAAAALPRGAAAALPAPPKGPILFRNLRVFDGSGGALRDGLAVLVEGNRIKAVDAARNPPGEGMQVIEGGGRTLMPGLIDAHWHAMMASLDIRTLMTADIGFITLAAADQAQRTLMRGFTSVRDMAGPSFALKRAIDAGLMAGPRIWPSGAMISQTSGHGDFRPLTDLPAPWNPPLSHGEALGAGMVADGVPQVLKRVREQLMLGASQIKLAAGGGVSSDHDPLDVTQYTEAEMHAAVEAAADWGTYVAVHAYTPRAIRMAVTAGVRCIEHGQLIDEATMRLLVDQGVWFSSQPFLDDEDATPFPEGSLSHAKLREMTTGTDTAYALAVKHRPLTAWGRDTLFSAKLAERQGAQLAKMKRWYGAAEILAMATGQNGALLAMSGPRTPYAGKIGVIAPGALADLLVLEGDPIAEIDRIADPERTLALIMKDGRLYRNRLA